MSRLLTLVLISVLAVKANPFLPILSGSVAAASYSATAATFAGDNQCWLELDGTGGVADGQVGTISFWWNPGTSGDTRYIFTTNNRLELARKGGDFHVQITIYNTAGSAVVELRQNTATVAALSATSGWCWVAISWDNSTAGRSWIYIANAATSWVATDCTTRTDDTGGGETLDYTDFDFSIGDALGGGAAPIGGCLSEFYADLATYRDLSSSAVRDLFYNSTTHKPTGNLSAVGSPIFYLRGDGTGFTVNSGNGGNLVKKGTTALTSCTGP